MYITGKQKIEMKIPIYDASFYSFEGPGDNLRSAQAVVPLINCLIQPQSVVDVGCGSGVWLSVFREHGVKQILGIEGSHVDGSWLRIPMDCIRFIDLSHPFELQETFDLAICLEVAEHLPPKSASFLVQSLVRLAPIILFSAAIPLQGGAHHINEQWPDYWRKLFEQCHFRRLDLIRKEIWKNPEVKSWYRQNMFLFVREDLIPTRTIFREADNFADDLLLIQPEILERQLGLRSILKNLPKSIRRATKYLMQRLWRSSQKL